MKNEDISVSCPGVSMVNPKASAGLINDEISAKLSQLRALTVSLCDAGFEGFNELNGELKESLLWMVTSSVQEVAVLWAAYNNREMAAAKRPNPSTAQANE